MLKRSTFKSRILMGIFIMGAVSFCACNNESDSGKMSSADSTKLADSTKKAVDAAAAKAAADTNKMKSSADTGMDKAKKKPVVTGNVTTP